MVHSSISRHSRALWRTRCGSVYHPIYERKLARFGRVAWGSGLVIESILIIVLHCVIHVLNEKPTASSTWHVPSGSSCNPKDISYWYMNIRSRKTTPFPCGFKNVRKLCSKHVKSIWCSCCFCNLSSRSGKPCYLTEKHALPWTTQQLKAKVIQKHLSDAIGGVFLGYHIFTAKYLLHKWRENVLAYVHFSTWSVVLHERPEPIHLRKLAEWKFYTL